LEFYTTIGHCTIVSPLDTSEKNFSTLEFDSPSFHLGSLVLGMEFQGKHPTFDFPMSSESVVLEIVLSWASLTSRAPRIISFMTHFIAT
jgi:hypothetical protein